MSSDTIFTKSAPTSLHFSLASDQEAFSSETLIHVPESSLKIHPEGHEAENEENMTTKSMKK